MMAFIRELLTISSTRFAERSGIPKARKHQHLYSKENELSGEENVYYKRKHMNRATY